MSRWVWRLLLALAILAVAGCAGGGRAPGGAARPAQAAADPPSVPAAAVQEALEGKRSGEAVRWRVAGGAESGTVTPVRTFRTAAGFCREYAVTLSAADGAGRAWRDVACRDPAGAWRPADPAPEA